MPPRWIFDPSQRLATAKMVQPSEAPWPSFSAPKQQELAAMLIPENAAFQNSLGSLAVVTYQPGEMVIADGSKTGRLLILKKGTVTIEK
jgi:hypothetical protein